MEIVDDFFTFLQNGKNEELLRNPQSITTQDLRIVVINILSWLRLEYKRSMWMKEGRKTKHKPLDIHSSGRWHENIRMLLETEEKFQKYFMINEHNFMFSDDIQEGEREKIREKVYNNYILEWNI